MLNPILFLENVKNIILLNYLRNNYTYKNYFCLIVMVYIKADKALKNIAIIVVRVH